MNYYRFELYHHGIKGQKWGVRRYQNADGSLTTAGERRYAIDQQKSRMKDARKASKEASKQYIKSVKSGFGIKNIQNSEKYKPAAEKAALKYIDERAKYKGIKSKNSERAEFNSYRKAMQKYGIRGSANDIASDRSATKLYDHIATKKGKEYADRVEKKVQNTSYTAIAVSAAVAVGSYAVSIIMATKDY